jgi:type IV pilus assembly protein PilC
LSPVYRYQVKDQDGSTKEGTFNAASLQEALNYLRHKNLTVLNLKEQSWGAAPPAVAKTRPSGGSRGGKKAKARDFMIFCRQFAAILRSGMTALQGLRLLSQQMEQESFREHLRQVAGSLEKGSSLAESFGKHPDFFPRILVNMVEAGEAGGILDTVMERLAIHFEKQHEMEQKIRSATLYPALITAFAVLVLVAMIFFVLPTFANIFSNLGVEMPWITRALMTFAGTVRRFWYLILGGIVILVAALGQYIKTEQGRYRYDQLRLRMPLFGPIYHKALISRFTRTLGTLLSCGVGVLNSLELTERVLDNVVMAQVVKRTREVIRQGQPMAPPLSRSGLFPPLVVEMVHVGEETGSLDEMLSHTAEFYENDVAYALDRLSSTLGPILLIVIAFMVLFVVVSIYLPIFTLYGSL